MTTPQETILAFIEKNGLVAVGTLRDHFGKWDIDGILSQLETAGLVCRELRDTIQGQHPLYRINKMPRRGNQAPPRQENKFKTHFTGVIIQ